MSKSAVSIHAPAWGATSMDTVAPLASLFQSTHPRGVRLNEQRRYFEGEVFQSTHPRGVRHVNNVVQAVVAEFQSTHPRGVRRKLDISVDGTGQFQSTHPRGVRRGHGSGLPPGGDVSIHAPAWGATDKRLTGQVCPTCFNPRTRVGCDAHGKGLCWIRRRFNPRTRVGCDARIYRHSASQT